MFVQQCFVQGNTPDLYNSAISPPIYTLNIQIQFSRIVVTTNTENSFISNFQKGIFRSTIYSLEKNNIYIWKHLYKEKKPKRRAGVAAVHYSVPGISLIPTGEVVAGATVISTRYSRVSTSFCFFFFFFFALSPAYSTFEKVDFICLKLCWTAKSSRKVSAVTAEH